MPCMFNPIKQYFEDTELVVEVDAATCEDHVSYGAAHYSKKISEQTEIQEEEEEENDNNFFDAIVEAPQAEDDN